MFFVTLTRLVKSVMFWPIKKRLSNLALKILTILIFKTSLGYDQVVCSV